MSLRPFGSIAAFTITMALAPQALAQVDEQAKHSHLLPHLADGGGWRSTVIVTNASESATACTLGMNGALMLDRFESGQGVTVMGATAEFTLDAPAGYLLWRTMNGPSTLGGYAKLDCDEAVTSQVVFEWLPDGAARPTGMATVFSSQAGASFQLPVLTPAATVGFAVANDTDAAAGCGLRLEDVQRNTVGSEVMFTVQSKTNDTKLLHNEISIPATFERGSATVTCDQQVSVIGLHFELDSSGIRTFNTLPPTVLSTAPRSASEDAYTVLQGLRVSSGRVMFSFFSAGGCIQLQNTTLNGVTYTVHSSKWQRRDNAQAAWTDIAGTERQDGLCAYTPTTAGEYRLVGEVSINGVRGMYASENTITVP